MASYVTLPGSRRTPMPNSRLAAGPVNKSDIASVTVRVRSSGDPATLVKESLMNLPANHWPSEVT